MRRFFDRKHLHQTSKGDMVNDGVKNEDGVIYVARSIVWENNMSQVYQVYLKLWG